MADVVLKKHCKLLSFLQLLKLITARATKTISLELIIYVCLLVGLDYEDVDDYSPASHTGKIN